MNEQQLVDYTSIQYLYKGRWISYWYQIFEVTSCRPVHTILEVGPGNMIVTNVLRHMGYMVKTIDEDARVSPDYETDIRNLASYVKERFDLIVCCQTLEHIPFDDVRNILKEFWKTSKLFLIVTLPYTSLGVFKPHLVIKLLPFLKPFRWIKIFDVFPKTHHLNRPGGHHWEIGKKGYPLKKILRIFAETGWRIEKHYPIFENPYHYMIVCRKNERFIA